MTITCVGFSKLQRSLKKDCRRHGGSETRFSMDFGSADPILWAAACAKLQCTLQGSQTWISVRAKWNRACGCVRYEMCLPPVPFTQALWAEPSPPHRAQTDTHTQLGVCVSVCELVSVCVCVFVCMCVHRCRCCTIAFGTGV